MKNFQNKNKGDLAIVNLLVVILISVGFLSVLLPSVHAVNGLEIIENNRTIKTDPGKAVTGVFTLNNTGGTALNVSFTGYVLSNGVDTLLIEPINNVSLPAGASLNMQFVVVVGASKSAGDYKGSLVAYSNSATDSLPITITVNSLPSLTLTPSEIDLGAVNRNKNYTASISVKNTGNSDITNLLVTSNANSKYNMRISPSNIFVMHPNESKNVYVNLTIPIDEAVGKKDFATLTFHSDQKEVSAVIKGDVKSRLVIGDVDAYVDDRSDRNLADGDTVGVDARPESSFRLSVRVDNDFTSYEDVRIRDVVVSARIVGIDDGADLKEESDTFDLSADSSKRVELDFKVPLEAVEDKYRVEITVEGKDENRVEQKDKMNIYLNVNKESHDVEIRRAELTPSLVKCEDSARLDVKVTNLGTHYEQNCLLTIKNPYLKLDQRDEFTLDNDLSSSRSSFTKTYYINIPKDLRSTNYRIELRTYYDYNKLSHVKTVLLKKTDCPVKSQPKNETTVEQPKKEIVVVQPSENKTAGKEQPIRVIREIIVQPPAPQGVTESDYILLLLILDALLFTGIIVGIAFYLKR